MGYKSSRRAIDALSLAIATGAPRLVKERLRERPELAKHWRPLHEAAFHGRGELARILLDAGADPNAAAPAIPPHFASRPLHRAIEQNSFLPRGAEHDLVVRLLVERGADVDARGGDLDLRPLTLALLGGARRFAQLLLAAGATVDRFAAAALGDREALARTLANGEVADLPDENGLTALHYAAASRVDPADLGTRRQLRDCAALLIESGASLGDTPHPPDAGEEHAMIVRTALEWAIDHGTNVDVVRLLLERGADPTRGDVLFHALMNGSNELASLLVHFGADVDQLTARGAPPLVALAQWGRGPMVEWLLGRGADPNARSIAGETALLACIRRGQPERMVRALLAAGADPRERDRTGHDAISLARRLDRRELLTLLGSRRG